MTAAVSTCRNRACKTQVEGQVATCPQCGGRMLTPRLIRTMGGLMIFCGIFLIVVIGYVASWLMPAMAHPGQYVGGANFSGTPEQARSIVMLFGAVGVFGLASLVYGLWMVVTGRRSIALMIGVLSLAAILVGATFYTLHVLPA